MYTTQFIRIIDRSSYTEAVIEKWNRMDQYTLSNGQVNYMMQLYAANLTTDGWTSFSKVMVF